MCAHMVTSGPNLTRLNARALPPEIHRIAEALLPVFYDQLKRIAHRARGRLGGSQTLQTTALVHEAFIRLGPARGFTDETHFLRAAALAMRHALINYAQARLADKRASVAIFGLPRWAFAQISAGRRRPFNPFSRGSFQREFRCMSGMIPLRSSFPATGKDH